MNNSKWNRSLTSGSFIYSNIFGDFTATVNVGTKTITITGLSYTLEAKHVVLGGLQKINASGEVSTISLLNVKVSGGVISLDYMSEVFATGDTVAMYILGPVKGYSADLDVTKIIDQSPDRSSHVIDSLLDTTNVAAGTNYYPSSTGMSMDGYKNLSLTGKLINADNTSTLTVEATNDEDTTNADWIQVYFNDDKAGIASGVNQVQAVSNTVTFSISRSFFNYKHFRVKLVTGDSTNTVIIKTRRSN